MKSLVRNHRKRDSLAKIKLYANSNHISLGDYQLADLNIKKITKRAGKLPSVKIERRVTLLNISDFWSDYGVIPSLCSFIELKAGVNSYLKKTGSGFIPETKFDGFVSFFLAWIFTQKDRFEALKKDRAKNGQGKKLDPKSVKKRKSGSKNQEGADKNEKNDDEKEEGGKSERGSKSGRVHAEESGEELSRATNQDLHGEASDNPPKADFSQIFGFVEEFFNLISAKTPLEKTNHLARKDGSVYNPTLRLQQKIEQRGNFVMKKKKKKTKKRKHKKSLLDKIEGFAHQGGQKIDNELAGEVSARKDGNELSDVEKAQGGNVPGQIEEGLEEDKEADVEEKEVDEFSGQENESQGF